MHQTTTVAPAFAGKFPVKPSVNPDAYYIYEEAEALGFGKYLKLRRAVKAGKLRAYFSGRNVRFKGADLISWLESQSSK